MVFSGESNMKDLSEYSFVDCVLLDFSMGKVADEMSLLMEAYYPLNPTENARTFGKVRLLFTGLREVSIQMHPAFHEDLQRPDDYKSNEVYFAQITPHDRGIAFELESDYLKMNAVARDYQLFHLNK